MQLSDKVELVALAFGLLGVADFLCNVNRMHVVGSGMKLRIRDMRPTLTSEIGLTPDV